MGEAAAEDEVSRTWRPQVRSDRSFWKFCDLEYEFGKKSYRLTGTKENSCVQQMLVTWTRLSCGITFPFTNTVLSVWLHRKLRR